ncbi:DUF3145 domain-containing protein [Brachybacterium sp. Marseille-Q7125]|uniref:DUF3145 domain-containing protein n=1 Tax=Brachybacterium sp. Marseille-Q7125 TaxID=2932815 RepID=UPI001FF67ACF|nr:DUF3145 domain-containing protein [Brachybacterium sp. Marseille-Q7125]
MTQGVLYIHSAPRALTPHIEWAAAGVIGVPPHMRWEEQSIGRGLMRSELSWRGREDTGAHLVSALRGMHEVRFEVTQEATSRTDGARWSCTPELGIHHAATDHAGNIVLTEDHVRGCMERAGGDARALQRELGIALGEPWDEELEIYRHAGEGVPMRWLHRVS